MEVQSDKKYILLFEDQPGDVQMISRLLEKMDDYQYEITNFSSISKALKALDSIQFDVILLDLCLDDSTGLDTFVKVNKNFPKTPIIILTGLDDTKLGIEAVYQGAQDYLVKKNISKNLLNKSIQYSIERKKNEIKLKVQAQELKEANHCLQQNYHDLLEVKKKLEEQIKLSDKKRIDLVSKISEISLKSADMAQGRAELLQRYQTLETENSTLRQQLIDYFKILKETNQEVDFLLEKQKLQTEESPEYE